MENGGIDCWGGCNAQQGKCDWCGTEGWCCQQGWVGNGCDGTFGGPSGGGHQCVLKPGIYETKTKNKHLKLNKKCLGHIGLIFKLGPNFDDK